MMTEQYVVKHLSYSSVSTWERCPREWWIKYVKGYRPQSVPAFAFGTAIHQAIQTALLHEHDFETQAKKFRNILRSALMKNDTVVKPSEAKQMLDMGHAILRDELVQAVLNNIHVSDKNNIERRVLFDVPGVPVSVVGYIDIIDDSGIPYDIKTSRYDWSEAQIANALQPDFYLTAMDAELDTRHKGNFRYVIVIKNTEAPVAYIENSYREGYRERVEKMVQDMWKGIEEKTWERIDPMICDCPMANTCMMFK